MGFVWVIVCCLLLGCKDSGGTENNRVPADTGTQALPLPTSSPNINVNGSVRFPTGRALIGGASLNIGKRTLALAGGNSIIRELDIDRYGRVVVAGRTANGSYDTMLVGRFASDGTPDANFGSNGIATVAFGTGYQMAHSVALQDDGKIVVAGKADPTAAAYFNFAMARLEEDGSLDSSFNGNGKLLTTFGDSTDIGRAIRVQDNGRILTTGYSRTPHHTFPYRFSTLRLFPDGSFDPSFGDGGKQTTAAVSADNGATSMVVQKDGKIVCVGTYTDAGHAHLSVIRYGEDGTLDPDFNENGMVNLPVGELNDNINYVQQDPEGRLVIVGSTQFSGQKRQAVVVRLLENGALDSNFGEKGILKLPNLDTETELRSLQIAEDSSMIAAGVICQGTCAAGANAFLLVRINSDGTLNSSFGTRGLETVSFFGGVEYADSIACTSDGACVAGGRAKNTSGVFELALYQLQIR